VVHRVWRIRNLAEVGRAASLERRDRIGELLVRNKATVRRLIDVRARLAAADRSVDDGLARHKKRIADGAMLGPVDRPVEAEHVFERALNVDDLLTVDDFDFARENLLNNGQCRAPCDVLRLALAAFAGDLPVLPLRFTVDLQTGSGFFF